MSRNMAYSHHLFTTVRSNGLKLQIESEMSSVLSIFLADNELANSSHENDGVKL